MRPVLKARAAALLMLHGLFSPGVLVGFNGLVSFTGGVLGLAV